MLSTHELIFPSENLPLLRYHYPHHRFYSFPKLSLLTAKLSGAPVTVTGTRAKIGISVSKLLVFGTFTNFLGFRFPRIWSLKKSRFRFQKIWSRKKVSVSENLVSEKKSLFQFRRIWSREKVSVSVSENFVTKKSLSFDFGKFGLGKKTSK